jgi:ATP-dependent protease ClpP protease subunit
MIDNLHLIERESRGAALARYYIEREAAADDNTTRKAWGLAVDGALNGRERNWFELMQTGDTTTVFIRDELGCGRETARTLLDALQGVNKIELWINSNGGDSACALELFRGLNGRVNLATVQGKCFSAAVTLAMSAKKIRVEQSAKFMLHKPRLFCYREADGLRQSADYLDRITGDFCKILAERTRQPAAVVNTWFSGDTYFSSNEAVASGLADEEWTLPAPSPDLFTGDGVLTLNTETPEESEFWRMLQTFDVLPVKNRKRFYDNLSRWLFYKTSDARE